MLDVLKFVLGDVWNFICVAALLSIFRPIRVTINNKETSDD